MIYLALTFRTDVCLYFKQADECGVLLLFFRLSPLCRQNGKEASRLPYRFAPTYAYTSSKPMSAVCCSYFSAYLPSVCKTEKKQADCFHDLRRRMLILQANRGGEMRRLFFVLLFPRVFEGSCPIKYRHLFGAVNILAEVACS